MMKNLVTITLAIFLSIQLFGQEISADDRVTITQSAKPYIGVYAFGYQGLPTPGYPQFQLNNYGGVPGTAAATADNSILGLFAFSGHNGSSKKTVGIIRVKSMENFASSLASRMDFLIGPNREQRMTILGASGDVGIGTETPSRSLEVHRTGSNAAIEISTDNSNSGNAQLFLRTNETSNDETHLRKWGASAGGTITGSSIPVANLTALRTGAGAGPLMMGTVGSNPLYLISNDQVGLYMNTSQEIGLGTLSPSEKLDVDGKIRMRTGATAGHVPVSDANGVMTWTDPSTFAPASLWEESGASIYTTTGAVGIGTSNPDYPMEIVSSFGQSLVLSTNYSDNYMGFKDVNDSYIGYAGIYTADQDMDFGTGYGNTTGDVHLVVNSTPAMTVENTRDVGIGTTNPTAQLHVEGDNTAQSLIYANATYSGAGGGSSVRGLDVEAVASHGIGYGAHLRGGYRGVVAYGIGGENSGTVRGLYGESSGSAGNRFGVYGYASNNGGTNSYGTYGLATNATSNYGIFGSGYGGTNNYAGYFSGNAHVTGTFTNPSDRKLKRNISKYENALDAIEQLEVKNYEYDTDKYSHMHLAEEKQIGFIAQELKEVLPHLVTDQVHPETTETGDEGWKTVIADAVDYKAINYIGLIPILTQGIKELSTEGAKKDETINELKSELSDMTKKMDEMAAMMNTMNEKFNQMEESMSSCCFNGTDSRTGSINTDIQLEGNDVPALEQNAPNPFSEQTVIKYYIPSFAQKATMTITDIKGSPLKSVNLENTGLGTVTIKANELPVGTYIYTLFVDGRQVESKQMILIK